MPKHLGGIGLYHIDFRQKALFKHKIIEIIENPYDDHNILLLSRLGLYPKLIRKLDQRPIISYRQLANYKIRYIRTILANRKEIKIEKMKEIYQEMISKMKKKAKCVLDTETTENFKLLLEEKITLLMEIGLKHYIMPT